MLQTNFPWKIQVTPQSQGAGFLREPQVKAQGNYRKECCLQQHILLLTKEGDPVSHESGQLAEQAKAEKVVIQKAMETQEGIFFPHSPTPHM